LVISALINTVWIPSGILSLVGNASRVRTCRTRGWVVEWTLLTTPFSTLLAGGTWVNFGWPLVLVALTTGGIVSYSSYSSYDGSQFRGKRELLTCFIPMIRILGL